MRHEPHDLGGRRHQQGAIAVSFILLVVLLLAIMGLATDAGRLYVSKSELQNAADACALAAAADLKGQPWAPPPNNPLQNAENSGITTGRRNLMGMQATPVTITANSEITFSDALNGTYRTWAAIAQGDVPNMKYARCRLSEDVSTIIMQVANALPSQSISPVNAARASAVATRAPSKSNCALPVAICKTNDIPGNWGLTRGQWIQGILSRNQNIQGAFKWVEYPGYARNQDLAALIEGQGQCDLTDTSSVGSHPGYIDSMLTSWNTRLGIYRPGGPTVSEAVPDATGWIYDPIQWPAQSNAYADYASRRSVASPKHQAQHNGPEIQGGFDLANPNNWTADANFLPGNDRRLVVGPIIDCNALAGNGSTQILDWACYLILNPVFNPGDTMRFEYRGVASDLASGCVTSGAPGGPTAGGPKVPALVQ